MYVLLRPLLLSHGKRECVSVSAVYLHICEEVSCSVAQRCGGAACLARLVRVVVETKVAFGGDNGGGGGIGHQRTFACVRVHVCVLCRVYAGVRIIHIIIQATRCARAAESYHLLSRWFLNRRILQTTYLALAHAFQPRTKTKTRPATVAMVILPESAAATA